MIAQDPMMGPDGWSNTRILLADTPFWAALSVASAKADNNYTWNSTHVRTLSDYPR
jgi:hypothetical protein